jgi:hypothetical protein
VENTLAYYDMATIMAVKSFIVQAFGLAANYQSFKTKTFGFDQISYRFISFMTKIFRSARISKLPSYWHWSRENDRKTEEKI